MNIPSIWAKQPGQFFCISIRSPSGKWTDNFFSREEFSEVLEFVRDHIDSDVYFCPHGFTRRKRRKEYAVLPKLCYADLDEADPRDFELKPSIVLETSPGRYAGFWITDLPITESLNRRLTYDIGADAGGWDLTQVLRFPGTLNHKYQKKPRVTTLWDDGPVYTIRKLDKVLPEEEVPEERDAESAAEILSEYGKTIPPWVRRELVNGRPRAGVRSDMLWRLGAELLECGVTEDEAVTLLLSSPWNKFEDHRDGGEAQLRRELSKNLHKHINGKKVNSHSKSNGNGIDLISMVQAMDTVEEKNVDWIWPDRLARGELIVVDGDPTRGKSYLLQKIAIAIADGKKLPSDKPLMKKPVQGKVLFFDIENSADTVTKKRLAGNKIQHPENYLQLSVPFNITDEEVLDSIRGVLEHFNPILVVFDTISNYMGATDTHKMSDTMQVLGKFRQLAAEYNCAIVALRHLKKGGGNDIALHRGQGSVGFVAMPRLVWTVGAMPEDRDTRVVAVTKNSFGDLPKAITFTITPIADSKDPDVPRGRSRMDWGDLVDISSDEIISTQAKAEDGSRKVLDEAKEFLQTELADGPVDHMKLKRMAEKRSISVRSLQRAADALGIQKIKNPNDLRWGLP